MTENYRYFPIKSANRFCPGSSLVIFPKFTQFIDLSFHCIYIFFSSRSKQALKKVQVHLSCNVLVLNSAHLRKLSILGVLIDKRPPKLNYATLNMDSGDSGMSYATVSSALATYSSICILLISLIVLFTVCWDAQNQHTILHRSYTHFSNITLFYIDR